MRWDSQVYFLLIDSWGCFYQWLTYNRVWDFGKMRSWRKHCDRGHVKVDDDNLMFKWGLAEAKLSGFLSRLQSPGKPCIALFLIDAECILASLEDDMFMNCLLTLEMLGLERNNNGITWKMLNVANLWSIVGKCLFYKMAKWCVFS